MSPVTTWVTENQGKHFCQCGCREAIIVIRHHHACGVPRIKKGHQNRGARNWKWKGGVVVDTRGYRLIHMPEHPDAQRPNGYILEHRLVAEKILGRRLRRDEHVHHINEIRTDNRGENLAILSCADHLALHNGRSAKVTPLLAEAAR